MISPDDITKEQYEKVAEVSRLSPEKMGVDDRGREAMLINTASPDSKFLRFVLDAAKVLMESGAIQIQDPLSFLGMMVATVSVAFVVGHAYGTGDFTLPGDRNGAKIKSEIDELEKMFGEESKDEKQS